MVEVIKHQNADPTLSPLLKSIRTLHEIHGYNVSLVLPLVGVRDFRNRLTFDAKFSSILIQLLTLVLDYGNILDIFWTDLFPLHLFQKVNIFTSRLRHGHRKANVLLLVVGTFYSQMFLIPLNHLNIVR